MKLANALKVIGAVLLLLSITLPMSSCTETKEPVSEQVSPAAQINSQDSEVKYHYITDNIDLKDPGIWVTFFAFVWPILILGLLQWKKTGRAALIFRGIEILLIISSLIWIDFIATFLTDRREVGAYLAYLALAIYAVGAIRCDVLLYRNRKNQTGQ